jgi:hypothetical protein
MVRDEQLMRIVDELEADMQQFAAPMTAPQLKEVHFASANMARSRDASGRSLKRH